MDRLLQQMTAKQDTLDIVILGVGSSNKLLMENQMINPNNQLKEEIEEKCLELLKRKIIIFYQIIRGKTFSFGDLLKIELFLIHFIVIRYCIFILQFIPVLREFFERKIFQFLFFLKESKKLFNSIF